MKSLVDLYKRLAWKVSRTDCSCSFCGLPILKDKACLRDVKCGTFCDEECAEAALDKDYQDADDYYQYGDTDNTDNGL